MGNFIEMLSFTGSPFPLRVGTRDQVKAERHSKLNIYLNYYKFASF